MEISTCVSIVMLLCSVEMDLWAVGFAVRGYKKKLYTKYIIIILASASVVWGQKGKCDQTPPSATTDAPSKNNDVYHLDIQTSGSMMGRDSKNFYTPAQTYVLTITTAVKDRPFKWFMITAEDPDVDKNIYDYGTKDVDVGILKTLDTGHLSRYSESCYSSVESTDYSEKNKIEVHWVSPKQSSSNQTIRIRATVAENNEAWYEGDELTIILYKDNKKSLDSPPLEPIETCNLCSEARYEVIFTGKWSRVAHPRHYPSKPDENGYSHMVGASHAYDYTLWQQDSEASEGLKQLAEGNTTKLLEIEIIRMMSTTNGTRTLIRGKRRHHPYMSEPSHALFRVDRYHHMFSIVVGMRPSPDWFLGTSKFELCTDDGWYEGGTIPLYPWDAGTMDGESYEVALREWIQKCYVQYIEVQKLKYEVLTQKYNESIYACCVGLSAEIADYPRCSFFSLDEQQHYKKKYVSMRSKTNPEDTVKRVEVGSFNRNSPFYQMNLNDLKPFACLTVRRLDVYPVTNADCSQPEEETGVEEEDKAPKEGEEEAEDEEGEEELEEPILAESKQKLQGNDNCYLGEWGAWSPCSPDDGVCGNGFKTRARYRGDKNIYFESYSNPDNLETQPKTSNCEDDRDTKLVEYKNCFIDCY